MVFGSSCPWLRRKTPRDLSQNKESFDAAVKDAPLLFKTGDEVLDQDGERCRVINVDLADAEKPYELEYPNGSWYWAAKSVIRPHKVRSRVSSVLSRIATHAAQRRRPATWGTHLDGNCLQTNVTITCTFGWVLLFSSRSHTAEIQKRLKCRWKTFSRRNAGAQTRTHAQTHTRMRISANTG